MKRQPLHTRLGTIVSRKRKRRITINVVFSGFFTRLVSLKKRILSLAPRKSFTSNRKRKDIVALADIPLSDVFVSVSWDGHIRIRRLSEDSKKIERVGVVGPESVTIQKEKNFLTMLG